MWYFWNFENHFSWEHFFVYFDFGFFLAFRKSAPKFLLDVYKNLNEEANENSYGSRHVRSTDSDEGENFITDVDKVAIEQSDIITTFLNKSKFNAIDSKNI